jgi:hypothetical protein
VQLVSARACAERDEVAAPVTVRLVVVEP